MILEAGIAVAIIFWIISGAMLALHFNVRRTKNGLHGLYYAFYLVFGLLGFIIFFLVNRLAELTISTLTGIAVSLNGIIPTLLIGTIIFFISAIITHTWIGRNSTKKETSFAKDSKDGPVCGDGCNCDGDHFHQDCGACQRKTKGRFYPTEDDFKDNDPSKGGGSFSNN